MIAMREVREIYHRGVWAVADAFRQLYEMIEVEEGRVRRLVAAATAAHLRKIEQLKCRIAKLEEELATKVRQVRRLESEVKGLNGVSGLFLKFHPVRAEAFRRWRNLAHK
jgi:predicted RNase H-like nuclease (RuvC/YqgF family)